VKFESHRSLLLFRLCDTDNGSRLISIRELPFLIVYAYEEEAGAALKWHARFGGTRRCLLCASDNGKLSPKEFVSNPAELDGEREKRKATVLERMARGTGRRRNRR